MVPYYLSLADIDCFLKVLPENFYKGAMVPMLISAFAGGTDGGGLPVSTVFGLRACSPLAASNIPNSSSFVMADGLVV
jgi:hypothetical protein